MNGDELELYIKKLIEENKLYKFYKTKEWLELRDTILKENHYECQWCKSKGKITKAVTVHHIQWVKKYPRLALSRYYWYKGKRYNNLVPLCHHCHDVAHNRFGGREKKKEFSNEEKW